LNENEYNTELFRHIENLNYSRKAGTKGEKEAAEYISSVFSKYGYEPIHEKFEYSPSSPFRSILNIILITTFLLFSLINLAYLKSIIVSFFILAFPLLIIIGFIRIDFFFKRKIKSTYKHISKINNQNDAKKSYLECQNIIVEYEHPDYEKHLYVTCHQDSISLRFSKKGISIILIIGIFSYLGYSILYLLEFILNFFNAGLFESYWYLYFILCLISIIFLNLLFIVRGFRTNVSHGSIDDATGISIILELSRIVKKIKPRLKITFVAFSSEEIGFFGSSYHFYRNKDNFNKETQIISIDMIGEIPPLSYVKIINPIVKLKTDKIFNQELEMVARDSNISFKGIKFFYPGSDFAVWLLNGYKTSWIYSKSKWIHSQNDIPSKINKKLMNDCLTIFIKYFEKFI